MQQEFLLQWALDGAKAARASGRLFDDASGDVAIDPEARDWTQSQFDDLLDS